MVRWVQGIPECISLYDVLQPGQSYTKHNIEGASFPNRKQDRQMNERYVMD